MPIHITNKGRRLFSINFTTIVLLLGLVYAAWYTHYYSIQERYNRLLPSVVTIKATIVSGKFLDTVPVLMQVQGSGTFIQNHYIVTAAHVVKGATTATIIVDDQAYNSLVIAANPILDIALIYVPDLKGKAVLLGDSDHLRIGDEVITVGSPLGLVNTLGRGFVSSETRTPEGTSVDVVQYWAQSYHGNSGGGVFNTDNELIGVVSYYYGTFLYDMAIPSNSIKAFIHSAIKAHKHSLRVL